MNRLDPLNDYMFLKMMGEEGDEEQLLSFLNAVLKRTGKGNLTSVVITNPKITAEIVGDKTSILDVRAKINDGTKTNIEVQLSNLNNMGKRSLFYWSREYGKGISAGQDYIELPNVITINIMGFPFLKIDDFHASFHLREDLYPEYVLDESLEIHFLDMSKFLQLQNKDLKNNPLHRWLAFFNKDTEGSVLTEVLEMDNTIRKANDKMKFVSQDPDSLRFYQMREMGLSDWNSRINYAKKEGLREGELKGKKEGKEEGLQQGLQEGKIEIAKNLLASGFETVFVAKITGIDLDIIGTLIDKTNQF